MASLIIVEHICPVCSETHITERYADPDQSPGKRKSTVAELIRRLTVNARLVEEDDGTPVGEVGRLLALVAYDNSFLGSETGAD